jgi:arylsulfatase
MHLFDKGWNALRDQVFDNQKKLGVIPPDAKLTPWPHDLLKNWDDLTDVEKRLFIRQADVYAAYLAYVDHEIGRVIQKIEDLGKLDDTLLIFITGDNGCSAEGSVNGTPNELLPFNGIVLPAEDMMPWYDVWGTDQTYPHFAVAWSWALDTPYKWTKQIPSFFGGTRQGTVISWPARIKEKGGVRWQFHHVIDIVPTILEATGLQAPDMVDGIGQKPIEGVSMVYTFDKANADAPSTRHTQYFEMLSVQGLYSDGWMLSGVPIRAPWELAVKSITNPATAS